jgi:quercetin dioxygenase-like cupin family protein
MSEREAQLRQQFTREGLRPSRWSNGPDAVYGAHDHPYAKVLVVVSGTITFTVEGRGALPMKSGDRLDLPPRTVHSAVVGPQGVVCLEAHVRPTSWKRRHG